MTDAVFHSYKVTDEGVRLTFSLVSPAPGQEQLHSVLLANGEVNAINSPAAFLALVQGKLRRKLQAEGIADKLDTRIGAVVTF